MAEVALTQEEKDTLKLDSNFKKFLQDSIMSDDVGGVGYLLRLTNFASVAQAIAYIVSRQIRSNPDIVYADNSLLNYLTIQMNVRDIDKKEDSGGGSLLDQVKAYLGTSNRINLLVEDYLAEKGKNW
jgi:hypothetical protein